MVERRNSQFAGCSGGKLLQRLGECAHVEARSISIMAVDLPRGIEPEDTKAGVRKSRDCRLLLVRQSIRLAFHPVVELCKWREPLAIRLLVSYLDDLGCVYDVRARRRSAGKLCAFDESIRTVRVGPADVVVARNEDDRLCLEVKP